MPVASSLSATELYVRMLDTYAAMQTYVDGGVSVATFVGGRANDHRNRIVFRTEFARPARLRFEYSSTPIYRDGRVGGGGDLLGFAIVNPERTWLAQPFELEAEQLSNVGIASAVCAFAGVTRGILAAQWRLLNGRGLGGCPRSEAHKATALITDRGSEIAGGRVSRRIQIEACADSPIDVWIDEGSYFVDRIFERTHVVRTAAEKEAELEDMRVSAPDLYERMRTRYDTSPSDFYIELTTDFAPRANVAIDLARFESPPR